MDIQDGKSLEINLPSREGAERIAMAMCADFAETLGFALERIEDVKTAVSEACMNAFEHGNQWRPDATVTVLITAENGSMIIRVIDKGPGITQPPPEPSIERKIEGKESARGFGIFMIRHLADEVTFEKIAGRGHTVTMVFKSRL